MFLTTRPRWVHFRSSFGYSPAQGLALSFSSNAHYRGALPQQLGAVWDLLLKADPEGPYPHLSCSFTTILFDLLSCCLCSTLEQRNGTRKPINDFAELDAHYSPRVWPQLPVETRRRLAQQVGQLVQRLRSRSVRSEEDDRADHDVVDR